MNSKPKYAEALIEVAEEIEDDPNYSGWNYYNKETHSLCAMSRILDLIGETRIVQISENLEFRHPDFNNGVWTRAMFLKKALALLVGGSEEVWDEFESLLMKMDRYQTARHLRLIYAGRHKTY